MSPGPEFVDDDDRPDASPYPPDELDTGRAEPLWWARTLAPLRRRPDLRRAGAVAVAGLVLVAAVLTVRPRDTVVAGDGAALPGPALAGAALPPAVAIVRGVVATRGALTDYVRQTAASGSCPTVPVGSSPTRAIRREVTGELPEVTVQDVASTLDEFTGLCSVRLRGRAAHGVALALVVSAPSTAATPTPRAFARVQVGTNDADDGTSTVWVSVTTAQGWGVVVGATGDPDALPSSATLQRLAQADGLTW